jgi:formylglycine-generating enzyme required for sulfatase activity
MKNTLKKIGFAAIIAVIGFATLLMTGCPPDDDDNGGGGGGGTGGGSSATVSIEMVSITGGTFTMGSPASEANRDSDETQHSVTLSGFYMSKYQVTQEQYQAVMGSNPSSFNSNPATGETQNKRPVENVTWYDAVEFCNKLSAKESLQSVYTISGRTPVSGYPITSATVTADFTKTGYRLPTEAQWEYACRAGTTTAYNTGDTISDNTGWYSSNSGGKTHEVGKKPANAFGLYDMHGNVWEWCWDWYDNYSSGTQTDPVGASSGTYRVKRGGSCRNSAENLRSAHRNNEFPNYRDSGVGFRLVRP